MRGPLVSDLDGTIADTAPAIFASMHHTCSVLKIELARDADLSWCLGPPLHWCLEQLGVDESRIIKAIRIFEDAHTERMDLVVPMPGADETIRRLAASGIQIGVATIKPEPIARLVLEAVGLLEHIKALHARSDDLDPRTKTDLVRSALAELDGSTPLYVGDHDNDEKAARDLGIDFMLYPRHSWDEILTAVVGSPAPASDR